MYDSGDDSNFDSSYGSDDDPYDHEKGFWGAPVAEFELKVKAEHLVPIYAAKPSAPPNSDDTPPPRDPRRTFA